MAVEPKKRHNWINPVVVDDKVNNAAMAAICGCHHLTPAVDAEMDEDLKQKVPLTESEQKSVNKLLAKESGAIQHDGDNKEDWENQRPSRAALDAIERGFCSSPTPWEYLAIWP